MIPLLMYSFQIYVRKCTELINYYKLDHLSLWFYVDYYAWLQFNILCPFVCLWICYAALCWVWEKWYAGGFISMSEHRSFGYSHLIFRNWILLSTRLQGDAAVDPVLWVSSYTNGISDWDNLLWKNIILLIFSYWMDFEMGWNYLELISVWFLEFVLQYQFVISLMHAITI